MEGLPYGMGEAGLMAMIIMDKGNGASLLRGTLRDNTDTVPCGPLGLDLSIRLNIYAPLIIDGNVGIGQHQVELLMQ